MRRGTRVGQAYIAVTADGDGINEEIVHSVEDAGPGIDKAGDEHGERYGDHFDKSTSRRLDRMFDRLRNRIRGTMEDSGDDSGDRFTRRFESHFDDRFFERIGRQAGGHLVDALIFAVSREGGDNPLADLFDKWMGGVSGNGGRGGRRKTGLTALDDWLKGTHSRSNVINFFAKSLSGVVHGLESMALGAKHFVDNMKGVEEGASLFQRISAGFGGGAEAGGGLFKSLAAGAGPAAAGIAVVAAGLTIMVSVVGSLIGLITALASTIVSGLVGALLVLGPALAGAAAAGGLLVAAFTSMTDAQQKMLKNSFLPIKKEFTGLGQIMLRDLVPAFDTWSKNLQHALVLALPVAQVMGKAFAEAGSILTRSFSGPGFQMFAQALTVWLPGITTSLSTALGGFLNGLLGIFSALMPLVSQFSAYLADVAERFSRWATSSEGQNSIVDFANRAVTSLKSLWNFTTSFFGFLNKVLFSPEAQTAGNTIFDSMARTFQNFTESVARAQANGSLKKWFDDAIKFGGQLWSVIESLGRTFISLYNSGVLASVGESLATLANVVNGLNTLLGPLINALGKVLPTVMKGALAPINAIGTVIGWVGDKIQGVLKWFGIARQEALNIDGLITGVLSKFQSIPSQVNAGIATITAQSNIDSLISSGNTALQNTSVNTGGFKPPRQWHNPWKKWANSLIKNGPGIAAQVQNAILSVNKQVAAAILSASRSADSGDVRASLESLMSSITTSGQETVNTAQQALNSAATSLANATSKGAAKKALKQVKSAQKSLAAALANQKKIQGVAKTLNAQRVVTESNVAKLLQGLKVQNATLADFAEARSRVARALDDANQQLTNAISLRDDYKKQVTESIRDFGSLLTTQASVINGVEQALSAADITTNLQDRLTKIKKFQDDLRLLLAQGLSNDAYKQIVDAGVEQGSTLAEALLAGGNGAIQNVNSLVGQINGIADSLGSETSNRMYQAGVDAAQGLVDGLTSLSAQLDAAAARLGNSIALSVKKALGIASPSKVLYDMMDYVGDGAALGLDNQHVKVGTAAARLASQIAVTPGGTYSSSSPGSQGVSGNQSDPRFRDLIVNTPTEDPMAVAMEVLNEVTGRI